MLLQGLLLGLTGISISLADSLQTEADARVERVLRANAASLNYTQWATSGETPHELFSDPTARSLARQLCAKLDLLEPSDLALFETEFEVGGHAHWLPCRKPLLDKLAQYWRKQGTGFDDLAWNASPRAPAPASLPSLEVELDPSTGPILTDGNLPEGQVALTFDDGPHPTRTQRILDILKNAGVRATFFSVGEMARHYPAIAREVHSQGHTVGSHSWSHPPLPKINDAEARRNILNGHAAITAATGFETLFFRFPYGARNNSLQKYVQELGMASFFWNMDSLDWKLRNPTKLHARVVELLNRHKRGILLFHDIHEQTVLALPKVLEELAKRTYTTVVYVPTLSQPRP